MNSRKIEIERARAAHWLCSVISGTGKLLLAVWLGATNALAFGLAGYDKWQAGRGGPRVAESTLCLTAAIGGWPGGLLGLLLFRHKTAKLSFQLKFTLAFAVLAALAWAGWRLWS